MKCFENLMEKMEVLMKIFDDDHLIQDCDKNTYNNITGIIQLSTTPPAAH